ncbi:hypothetical protein IFM89_024935 [Coptis chinensis]|uniref:F-box/LRR-repeat protein 15/At3g58940/PEG3-like LRR domain-containing protein n=1 Tax=Coptis chinensis TaxID=261450 RepID=A0A835I6D5_9MAGN|nr:hypothetical protein IFM89_024935 [Coptis chinensis]
MEVDEVFISDDSTLKQVSECCPNFIKLEVCNSVCKNTALLIATFLPKLKILDISSTNIHRKDLLVILKGCVELESLDITNCGKIHSDDEILKIGCRRLEVFKWDNAYSDYCSECEEENEDMSYQWPCAHVMDEGFSTYIEGTYDLFPFDPVVNPVANWEYEPFVDEVADGASGASNDHYDNGERKNVSVIFVVAFILMMVTMLL